MLGSKSLIAGVEPFGLDVGGGQEIIRVETKVGLSFHLHMTVKRGMRTRGLELLSPCHALPYVIAKGVRKCSYRGTPGPALFKVPTCDEAIPIGVQQLPLPFSENANGDEFWSDAAMGELTNELASWLDMNAASISPLEIPLIVEDLVYDFLRAQDQNTGLAAVYDDALTEVPSLRDFRDRALREPVDWSGLSSHEVGMILGSLMDLGDPTVNLSHFEQLTAERSPHEIGSFLKELLSLAMSETVAKSQRFANRRTAQRLIPLYSSYTRRSSAT